MICHAQNCSRERRRLQADPPSGSLAFEHCVEYPHRCDGIVDAVGGGGAGQYRLGKGFRLLGILVACGQGFAAGRAGVEAGPVINDDRRLLALRRIEWNEDFRAGLRAENLECLKGNQLRGGVEGQ